MKMRFLRKDVDTKIHWKLVNFGKYNINRTITITGKVRFSYIAEVR